MTDTTAARTLALYRLHGRHQYVITLRPVDELGLHVVSAAGKLVDSDQVETFPTAADRDAAWAAYVREYTASGYAEVPGYEFLADGRIRTYKDLLGFVATAAAEKVCRDALAAGAARVNFRGALAAAIDSVLEHWRRDDLPKWFGYLAEIGAPLVP